jgi:FMN reductase
MPTVLTIAGSPSPSSRTGRLTNLVDEWLREGGLTVDRLNVRELPAEALMHAKVDDPAISDAALRLERADAVVIASPIYKAAYSGILKTFLDLLPQFALTGKTVLPLATGGSMAHVLAIDYALRPVLSSLGAKHIVEGLFVLDKLVEVDEAGKTRLDPDVVPRLRTIVDNFTRSLAAHHAHR